MSFLELLRNTQESSETNITEQKQKLHKNKDCRKRNSLKYSEEIQNGICDDYLKNILTLDQIVVKYGVSHGTVQNYIKLRGLSKSRRIKFNENYFETIDTSDKAYFLGFITGDGNIENQSIKIEISIKDKHILEDFKTFLKSEHSIYQRTRILNGKSHSMCTLKLSREKIVKDLNKYGITKNKSNILTFPTNLPSNLMSDYIRGLIDSDGGWYRCDNKLGLMFCSSVELFIREVQLYLIKKCNLAYNKIYQDGNCFIFRFTCKEQCKRLYDFIYQNDGPKLHRKYNRARNYFEYNLLDENIND